MAVKMIARKRLTYASRIYRTGDSFEASNKDALVLEAIGSAQRQEETPPPVIPDHPPEETPAAQRRRSYRSRELEADDGSHQDGPPRRYRRRDLRAEGSDA